jgi:PleD family two-component response regulator
MTILIVDDTPTVAALISGLLSTAGLGEAMVASDATEALRVLGVEPKGAPAAEIDLVLMDILMPEMDGIEACSRLKADPRLADLPVVMISTLNNAGYLHQAFAAGAVDYIAKPIQADELEARVRSALRTKQALDQRLVTGAAPVDPVTGLPTMPVLSAALDTALAGDRGGEQGVALVLLGLNDWNGYAALNGPAAADRAIRQIADRLAALFGSLGDLLVRLDAGRFALLCRSAAAAEEAAGDLRRHVDDMALKSHGAASLTATTQVLRLAPLPKGITGAATIALAVKNLVALQPPGGAPAT